MSSSLQSFCTETRLPKAEMSKGHSFTFSHSQGAAGGGFNKVTNGLVCTSLASQSFTVSDHQAPRSWQIVPLSFPARKCSRHICRKQCRAVPRSHFTAQCHTHSDQFWQQEQWKTHPPGSGQSSPALLWKLSFHLPRGSQTQNAMYRTLCLPQSQLSLKSSRVLQKQQLAQGLDK